MPTIEEYYEGNDHGNYQYVTLNAIVDDLIEDSLDQDSYLKNTKRSQIIKHVKRGIRVMNFNVLNNPKILELELSSALSMVLPVDYVDWLRISVIGDDGYLYPLGENRNIHIGKTYLQAHDFEILFSEEGDPLEANSSNAYSIPYKRRVLHPTCQGGMRTVDTSRYNANGEFRIDKENGTIAFSSDLSEKAIVIEYVSDGMEDEKVFNGKLKIHKYIVDAVIDYAYWQIIRKRRNVRAIAISEARREYFNSRREAKKRISSIKVHEIFKAATAANYWI